MSNVFSTTFDSTENHLTYDYNLDTSSTSACTGTGTETFQDYHVQMNHPVKLQTLFLRLSNPVVGGIYGTDRTTGAQTWCVEDVTLDGFIHCELYTDSISIRVDCQNSDVSVAEFYLLEQRIVTTEIEVFTVDGQPRQDAFGLV
jgi:hypothetical protein